MFEQLLLGVYYDIIIELNLNLPSFSWKKNKKMQNFTFDLFFFVCEDTTFLIVFIQRYRVWKTIIF